MTDAQKREKVIAGLEWMAESYIGLVSNISKDALALLKAQEPRVMTLEEVQISDSPIWIEGGLAGGAWGMMPKTLETIIEFVANGVYTLYPGFAIAEYGVSWRCWTSRPDEKTREGTPWA